MPPLSKMKTLGILSTILFVISIVVTQWIGGATMYGDAHELERDFLHYAILANEPPNGAGWSAVGANSLNIRVATVAFAEYIHQLSGLQLSKVYKTIDLLCLFLALHIIWMMLRIWYSPDAALTGVLLFSALVPLTMFFGYFQPWDRPSLLLWAGLALSACEQRMVTFTALYVLSIVVKFDAITAVALVVFLNATFQNYLPLLARAAVYSVIGIATLAALMYLFPGGQEARSLSGQFSVNLWTARSFGLFYPPLLVHGLLFLLGALGWVSAEDQQRRLWLCGLFLLVPHILFTNLVEVRAQVATVVCMLPLALHGVLSTLHAQKNVALDV